MNTRKTEQFPHVALPLVDFQQVKQWNRSGTARKRNLYDGNAMPVHKGLRYSLRCAPANKPQCGIRGPEVIGHNAAPLEHIHSQSATGPRPIRRRGTADQDQLVFVASVELLSCPNRAHRRLARRQVRVQELAPLPHRTCTKLLAAFAPFGRRERRSGCAASPANRLARSNTGCRAATARAVTTRSRSPLRSVPSSPNSSGSYSNSKFCFSESRSESRGLCLSNMAKAWVDPASRVIAAPSVGVRVTGIPTAGERRKALACFSRPASSEVERLFCNQRVGGSNPSLGSILRLYIPSRADDSARLRSVAAHSGVRESGAGTSSCGGVEKLSVHRPKLMEECA